MLCCREEAQVSSKHGAIEYLQKAEQSLPKLTNGRELRGSRRPWNQPIPHPQNHVKQGSTDPHTGSSRVPSISVQPCKHAWFLGNMGGPAVALPNMLATDSKDTPLASAAETAHLSSAPLKFGAPITTKDARPGECPVSLHPFEGKEEAMLKTRLCSLSVVNVASFPRLHICGKD